MTEPRDKNKTGTRDDESASTSNAKRQRETANDRSVRNREYKGPAPQGGRGTPSQAEGEREPSD